MIKNYFIVAWRSLWRNRLYSFINIAGLAIGISSCVLIYLYVQHELSYDSFNEKSDSIYRLTLDVHQTKNEIESASTAPLMGPLIKNNFPEIKNMVRLGPPLEQYLNYNDKKLFDTKIVSSDSTFFDVFTFPMIAGDPKTALNAPYKIVLSESTAKKLFGNGPVLGKTLRYNINDAVGASVMVSGVMKDVPENSHLTFDALVSRSTLLDLKKNDTSWMAEKENNWAWIFQYTYFLLDKNTNVKALEAKISALTEKQYPDQRDDGLWYSGKLQPLKSIHLHSAMDREIKPNSDIKYVYIFSGTAFLILLIACFNFINLSTARSINRSKEIGLRKVIGAARHQLIQQFLGESVLFTLLAAALSVFIVWAALPFFSAFTGAPLKVSYALIILYSLIILTVGLFSGLYPAFLVSSFKPVTALKGHVRYSWQDLILRKGLVVFQFSIAIALIAGTQVILKQLHFVQSRKTGMQQEQMLQLTFRTTDKSKQQTFLKELASQPGIVNASLNSFSFKRMNSIPMALMDTEDPGWNAENVIFVDENFLNTFQLSTVAGRPLTNSKTDEQESFLVNETAVKAFGWKSTKDALGKHINWAGYKTGQVVGVVKDFNYTSLHEPVKPLVMHIWYNMRNGITIRMKTKNLPAAIKAIETKWQRVFPGVPFDYSFMQDDFNAMYKSEQKLASLLGAFTGLAIGVSCLGLVGLVAFTIRQRVREIGIRKILGSDVSGIVWLLSKDFLKLICISIVIAVPVSWLVMNRWLQDFAYRTEISWWLFSVAGTFAISVAFITISFQTIRAAVANPVKNLRTE